jgi:DNA repair exonuclease SbcCD ATPase subunit
VIPLRVYLKNFLCHREQAFCFDGHAVWLLYGDNGVGKSAVFDAMVYALFGEHKRTSGRNVAADLIRHGESSFRVEFDFEFGGKCYRIWRTRARGGSTKQGVLELVEGNPVPVRDVNGVRELDAWVSGTLGLNYDHFVSAVLLRQGAAEKLIDADKDARRELFRGIIDLEPYLQLHEAVTAARAELTGVVRSLRAALERMPVVDDSELAIATQARDDALAAFENARTAEQAARDRLGHARLWEQLANTSRDLCQQLTAAADRAARASELERAVARLQELRVTVPALAALRSHRAELATAEGEFTRLTTERNAVMARQATTASAAEQERQKAAGFRARVSTLDHQFAETDHRCQRLREQIQQADNAAELHNRLATRRDELSAFAPHLDTVFAQAESAAGDAQASKDALPHLEVLARHRQQYRQATADAQTAAQLESDTAAHLTRLTTAETEAKQAAERANNRQAESERAVAVAEDRLAEAIRRRDQFTKLAGAARCSECDQEIGPEHARCQQSKLEQLVSDADGEVQRCRGEQTAATYAATHACRLSVQCEAGRRDAEGVLENAATARRQAEQRSADARIGFDVALAELTEDFRGRVPGIEFDGFPTAEDLADLRRLRSELPQRTQERERLGGLRRKRDACAGDVTTLEQAVRAVGAPPDVSAARAELSSQELALVGLNTERTQTNQSLSDAEEAERTLASQVTQLAEQVTDLSTQVGGAENAVNTARRGLADALQAVPAPYRENPPAENAQLAEELKELEESSAESDYAAMAEDRTLQAERMRLLDEAGRQLAGVPEDARRPASEVLPEVPAAEQALQGADELRRTAAERLDRLNRQRAERQEAELGLVTEERNHTLHDRLAGLLGDRGIQLDLVRDAERRIIELANDILVRVSTGDLRFDPPDPASERSFDLTVRRADCPGPIAVANLSGGQRFRVAVSLALAVCRFANGERRPLESVIIDEGFGCLDRDGRMAMIAELRDGQALARMFKRVLVVSHQEDFAAAFPVGYRLRSEGGMTTVESFGLQNGQ